MKKSTLRVISPARFVLTGSLFVFGLGMIGGLTTDAQAQGRAGARRKGLTKKVFTSLQEKTGKPVTPEMRQKLTALAKTRDDAIEEANNKFYADFAAATGLTLDQAKEITTPARGAGAGGRRGGAMAPAAAPGAPAAQ